MRLLGILLVFMLCPLIHAQEKRTNRSASPNELPDAPKPKINRRVFIAGVSLLAASKSADVWSTRSLLGLGGWENNPTLGRHPSSGRLVGHASAVFAGQSAAFYLTEHNRRAWVRWAGRAYIGFAIEEHARLAACNSRINTHSPNVQNCRPLLPF
ncbi:MAG: hypothetical protein DMG76_02695 [Acidobacteria bacterium]|nr:MAG: hypothetical protein DMG76_02695 [Acidobacteriota bacterium]